MVRAVLAILATIVVLLMPARAAAVAEQVPVGPRAIAMGGAFSAVADDGWSLAWNPAALPWIGRQELLGSRAQLFGSELTDSYAGVVVPIRSHHAAGLGWYHSGLDDNGLGFSENRFDASWGGRIGEILSIGATARFMTRQIDDDGVEFLDGRGWGADAGLRVQPTRALALAVVGRDLFDTRVDDGDLGAVAYPRLFSVGAAYRFSPQAMVTMEVDDRLHAGVELSPVRAIAVRAGVKEDPGDGLPAMASAGVGINLGGIGIDYAWESHPVLGATSHFGLALSLNLNPARVRIERVEIHDLYASFYKSYESRPIGSVRIRNLRNEAMTARIRINDSRLMDRPTETEVILRPGATQDVPLTAVFADRVMSAAEDRFHQLEISASYESARLERTDRVTARCLLYAPGAVDWSHGVEQLRAFVTPGDPVVAGVARAAVQRVAPRDVEGIGNRNLAHVAAVLDALAALDFRYAPDPIDGYSTRSGSGPRVDSVRYPRQSLAGRSGDCDDTSALVAALLANIGIESRLVDVPGHLFLLVDTGLDPRNRAGLSLPDSWSHVLDGRVWIPIETTRVDGGLDGAWEAGVSTWSHWQSIGQLHVVDLAGGEAFLAALPAGSASAIELPPDPGVAGASAARVAARREAYLLASLGPEAGWSGSPDTLLAAAHVRFLSGRRSDALALLEAGAALYPGPSFENDLGAVALAMGDSEAALRHFDRAVKLDPGDAGIWLNRGLALAAAERHEEARAAIDRGIAICGSYEAACRLLALPPPAGESREGATRLTVEATRGLLLATPILRWLSAGGPDDSSRVSAAPADTSAAAPDTLSNRLPVGDPRWRTRTLPSLTPMMASARADEEMDLALILYWKR